MVAGRFFRRLVDLTAQVTDMPALPFSEYLTEFRIQAALQEHHVFYRDRVFSPAVTLWTFLSQVLSEDQSCRDALARLLAFRMARGQASISTDTGSYCTARKRLPEKLVAQLTRQTGQEIHRDMPADWQWQGRPVKVVDGTTVSMPDTPSNEAVFDKPRNQRGRSAFPVARLLVIFCLATGAALQLAIGPCRGKRTGELTLLQTLENTLEEGDILLGDSLFCTYCVLARAQARGVDVVMRQHVARQTDFRRGQRLGREDHLVAWTKPTQCPDWLTTKEFAAIPAELTVREARVRIATPGFRVRSLIVVTTLTDADLAPKRELAQLFRARWQAELNLRSIKTVMHMDVLRCQSAAMVRKELWVHLLAYNLLRSVMCAAAVEHQVLPWELSFKGTLQILNAFYQLLITSTPEDLELYVTVVLHAVRDHRVANRPDRCEPRKRRRSPKPYATMKESRDVERKRCL